MKIDITGRGHGVSDLLRDYIETNLEKLNKHSHGSDSEVHVVLEREGNHQIVEITLHAMHKTIHTQEKDESVHACVDKAVNKIDKQLRKQKEKITERRP